MPILAGPNRGRLWTAGTLKYFTGRFERRKATAVALLVREGDICWDIGAHRGYFTLILTRGAKKGQVIAFEPEPKNFEVLARHCRWNRLKGTTIFQAAVCDWSGSGGFTCGKSSLGGRLDPASKRDVEVVNPGTLIIQGHCQAPTFLKIDAEHSEAKILRSFGNHLASPNLSIVLSVHTIELAEECARLLETQGMSVLRSEKLVRCLDTGELVGDADLFAFGASRLPTPELTLDLLGCPLRSLSDHSLHRPPPSPR